VPIALGRTAFLPFGHGTIGLQSLTKMWKWNDGGESTMRRTVVNARGQVTIPAALRAQLEIKPGTGVTWFEEEAG
jgi:AbrB family looped-hinge helix DNA binding protein